jgi:hypothetical protein
MIILLLSMLNYNLELWFSIIHFEVTLVFCLGHWSHKFSMIMTFIHLHMFKNNDKFWALLAMNVCLTIEKSIKWPYLYVLSSPSPYFNKFAICKVKEFIESRMKFNTTISIFLNLKYYGHNKHNSDEGVQDKKER